MKSLYLLLIAFSFVLVSCSSSYRSSQTIDDVYFSPAVEVDNGNSSNHNGNSSNQSYDEYDEGDYVTMQGDESSYGYRNDVQEEWYIRRGIRNPYYRNSVSINLGFGGYSPYYNYYDPFYTPMFTPYSYYGYSPLWNNPFYYNYGWLNYSPYGFGHFYNPYGSYYGNYYPHYGSNVYFNSGRLKDNGPRVMNLSTPRFGINASPRTNNDPNRPQLAPVRIMRNNNNQNGTIERRITPRNNTNIERSNNNNRNVRKFNNNRSNNNNYRTPAPTENRRYTPPRRNDVSPTPNRTFERPSTPSVDRTPSTPPSTPPSNNNGNKSAPVRKF